MTPPPRPPRDPSLDPSLGPERLADLLEDAVRHVTAPGDALDRIRRGVRRRRTARRAGAVLLAVAVLAGGGSTALAVTSGRGPSELASSGNPSSANAPAANVPAANAPSAVDAQATYQSAADATTTAASADLLPPSGRELTPAPSPDSSGNVAAKAAAPSVGQASPGPPALWDIDGDGRPDTATLVAVGNAETTSSFQLVVHLSRFGAQTVPFTATSAQFMPPHGPVIIGAADAAHDGHTELFVQVDSGCCTEFWTIFRLVNGQVKQMTMAGHPVRIAVGGTVSANAGFSCAGADLVAYAYQAGTTAGTFLATRDTYRWVGAALVLIARQPTTIRGTPQDPVLATYSGVTCGGLSSARGEL
ncbi:MAG: hypothetical protein ACRDPD_34780 [Streptosporangiaceae bacterium]